MEKRKKYSQFSRNLRYIRQIKGLSREAFAKKINVTYGMVISWEFDKTKIQIDDLQRICKEFHVTMDELFNSELSDKVKIF